jgi:methionyl aminopeptidase
MTTKTPDEVKLMEKVCRLAVDTLLHTAKFARAGVSTDELDRIAHDFTLSHDAKPSPLGYHGFPKSICTSLNDVVCHGVPDATLLKDGDILNIDVTCYKWGFHGDTSMTVYVGEPSERARRLVECAEQAMMKGIEAALPWGTTGDIGFAINKFVTKNGYHSVREIGGHGIGRAFHEEPFVPSFGKKGRGDRLKPWATITVEPMINENSDEIVELAIPNSSIKYYVTGDQSLSAQFEHTILLTDTGHEILTAR